MFEKLNMEVFLMIKRQKVSIFLDVKADTRVQEVKRMIGGIVKRNSDDMKLIYKESFLDDNKTVSDCGMTVHTTKAQSPALIGLVFKVSENEYEDLDITPVSTPPELPPQMKTQESPTAGS